MSHDKLREVVFNRTWAWSPPHLLGLPEPRLGGLHDYMERIERTYYASPWWTDGPPQPLAGTPHFADLVTRDSMHHGFPWGCLYGVPQRYV